MALKQTLKHIEKSLGGPNQTTHFGHSYIKDHRIIYKGPPCILFWKVVKLDNKMRLVAQLDHLVAQKNHKLLKPPNVWWEVCIQTQGGFSRWWFICATRWSNCTTEFSHSFQQNHLSRNNYQFFIRVVLPRPQMVLNKRIYGPY